MFSPLERKLDKPVRPTHAEKLTLSMLFSQRSSVSVFAYYALWLTTVPLYD
jgi:hypothetical protein